MTRIDEITTTDSRYHAYYIIEQGRPRVAVYDAVGDSYIADGTGHTLTMPPDPEGRDTRNALPSTWIRFAYQAGFTVVYPDGIVIPGWSQEST